MNRSYDGVRQRWKRMQESSEVARKVMYAPEEPTKPRGKDKKKRRGRY